ncbi:unnamed protein product [Trichogramma brassicae]|uniref:Uncharacterized protein n=1 Tax=Trichogramma brassicae TaxID=86971 RepID=A0A6H5J693_9HYME|nr:unnamed protein product [Trichogramma brassicae]
MQEKDDDDDDGEYDNKIFEQRDNEIATTEENFYLNDFYVLRKGARCEPDSKSGAKPMFIDTERRHRCFRDLRRKPKLHSQHLEIQESLVEECMRIAPTRIFPWSGHPEDVNAENLSHPFHDLSHICAHICARNRARIDAYNDRLCRRCYRGCCGYGYCCSLCTFPKSRDDVGIPLSATESETDVYHVDSHCGSVDSYCGSVDSYFGSVDSVLAETRFPYFFPLLKEITKT